MKQFYVASFFFVFTFLILNSCSNTSKIETTIPKEQLEEFKGFISTVKSDSIMESKLQLVNSYLKKIKNTEYDSLLYETLIIKTALHKKYKEVDSAINFSNKLYTVSKNNNDSIYMAKALTKLGLYYKSNNELTKAFKSYNQSFIISEALNNNIEAGKRLYSMSNIQKNIGDFVGSKVTAIDGIEFLESTNELRYLSWLYHTVSVALKEEGKYIEALEFNTRALKTANSIDGLTKKKTQSILIYKNTKANILREQKKFKEAISIYNLLLRDPVVINNKKEYARVLDNKAYTLWLENNNNNESLSLMKEALELRNAIKDINGLVASNIHLAKYFYVDNKLEALKYAEAAYKEAKSINAMDDKLEALDYIFKLSSNTNISNSLALDYSDTNTKLNTLKSKTQDIYATTKYNIKNERIRADQNKLKFERQKSLNVIYISVAFFILLLSIFSYFLLEFRHKKQKLQEVYNTETRISKRVHDEVANDVYQVMTKLQSSNDLKEEVLDDMESIYNRTRDISNENSAIELNGTFDVILSDLLLNYKNETVNIITKDLSKITWSNVSKTKKTIIYRVLQELMVNMKKHSEASLVVIKFGKQNRKVTIDYTDNGNGMSSKKGNGLTNVENRIKSINGTFNFETDNKEGFVARITV